MSNIIPFDQAKVPAAVSKFAGLFGSNAALMTRSGPSYDVLTIKGKVWRVVDAKTKERVKLTDANGDVLPAVQVVIVRANDARSKVFYKDGYEEGNDAPPDCFSHDGIKPDASVKEKQCATCAACPHEVWGSGKEGKGRACADSRRIAVAPENDLDKVMLLRVPAASLKNLSDFGATVEKRGLPYQAVVTRISFDPDAASPKLVFRPIGILPDAMVEKVASLQEDETVKAIIGLGDGASAEHHDAPAKAPAAAAPKVDEEAKAAAEAAAAKAEKARKAAEKKAKAEAAAAAAAEAARAAALAAAEDDDEDDAPAPAVEAKVETKAKPAASAAALPADVAGMLDGLNFDD